MTSSPAGAQVRVWADRTEIIPEDLDNVVGGAANPYDYYGASVALDGSLAIVGAPDQYGPDYLTQEGVGAAYVYAKTAEGWTLEAKLGPMGALHHQRFGYSVDISGDTAIVGAYGDDVYAGSAYVFVRGRGGWSLQQKLTEVGQYSQQTYGMSVSISGDTAVVGARAEHVGSWIDAGAVYVYRRANGVWSLEEKLFSPFPDHAQQFGHVAVSGDTLAVGAWFMPYVAGPREVVSSAYVFSRDAGVWGEGEQLFHHDTQLNDEFGCSVDVSGDTVVVGAQQSNSYFYGPGAAYVFVRGTGGWVEQQKLTASDGVPGDDFGHSVAIDGDSILVGAWIHYDPVAGAVYAFTRRGGVWTQTQELKILDSAHFDAAFGASVAVAGPNAVVGAPFQFLGRDQEGAAYAFTLKTGDGGACVLGAECASGDCVDSVCCNDPCSACGVCSAAAGAVRDGVCTPKPLGTLCRPAMGDCDHAEACDGSSFACPADGFAAASTQCRAASGGCDVSELCTGASATCPADGVQHGGFICREATDSCDVAEQCDGIETSCGPDFLAPRGTVCRPALGLCDAQEACAGTSRTCPDDAFLPAGTTCRPAAGSCDVGEACIGAAHCPSDELVVAGISCRAAGGPCDRAEACDGVNAVCPDDALVAAGTECRGAAGPCDRRAACDGEGAACPENVLASSTEICRAGADVCDAPEHCTGVGVACPLDGFLSARVSCRAARHACDIEETCDGRSGSCPSDTTAADGTGCAGGSCLEGECLGGPHPTDAGGPRPEADAGTSAEGGSVPDPPVGGGGAGGTVDSGPASNLDGGTRAADASPGMGDASAARDEPALAASEGGCGCRVGSREQPGSWGAPGGALMIWLIRRRRRRTFGRYGRGVAPLCCTIVTLACESSDAPSLEHEDARPGPGGAHGAAGGSGPVEAGIDDALSDGDPIADADAGCPLGQRCGRVDAAAVDAAPEGDARVKVDASGNTDAAEVDAKGVGDALAAPDRDGGDSGREPACTPSDTSRCPAGADPDCQEVSCDAGECRYANLTADALLPSRRQTRGDCRVLVCDGDGGVRSRADVDPPPEDGTCLDYGCLDGVRTSTPKAEGTSCTSGVCHAGECFESLCVDGALDGTETDVDCGGECLPCADDRACDLGSDCASGVCTSMVCAAPSCVDRTHNGNEADVDCGGPCDDCPNGAACNSSGDCRSGVCSGSFCQSPECGDGVVNGDETGRDCGGPVCARCPPGEPCVTEDDCRERVCANGTCLTAMCADGVKNQTESDIDCGGTACGPCGEGADCSAHGDCTSAYCFGTPRVCTAVCGDGLVHGNETCDDANAIEHDGCDACRTEEGYVCVGEPGECAPVCSDRRVVGNEDCDDGNVEDDDGCASTCRHDLWARDSENSTDIAVTAVRSTAAGEAVLLGTFSGFVDFGSGYLYPTGSRNGFIAKFDPSGQLLFADSFDGDHVIASDVAVDTSGNLVVVGEFNGRIQIGSRIFTSDNTDVFVVKLDPSGVPAWAKAFRHPDVQRPSSVAIDADANVIISGGFYDSIDLGGGAMTSAGLADAFVVKLDPDGAFLWNRRFGDDDLQHGGAVATDAVGNVYLSGNHLGSIDFGLGPLTTFGANDVFVAKLSAAGTALWSHGYGIANSYESITDLAVDASGNVWVTGAFEGFIDFGNGQLSTSGGFDVFLAKLDTSGAAVHSARFGSTGSDVGAGVAVDAQGSAFLTGWFHETVDFGGGPFTADANENVFVAKFDAQGDHTWSKAYGDETSQRGLVAAADPLGRAYVAGTYGGTLDVTIPPLVSPFIDRVFLAKFAP